MVLDNSPSDCSRLFRLDQKAVLVREDDFEAYFGPLLRWAAQQAERMKNLDANNGAEAVYCAATSGGSSSSAAGASSTSSSSTPAVQVASASAEPVTVPLPPFRDFNEFFLLNTEREKERRALAQQRREAAEQEKKRLLGSEDESEGDEPFFPVVRRPPTRKIETKRRPRPLLHPGGGEENHEDKVERLRREQEERAARDKAMWDPDNPLNEMAYLQSHQALVFHKSAVVTIGPDEEAQDLAVAAMDAQKGLVVKNLASGLGLSVLMSQTETQAKKEQQTEEDEDLHPVVKTLIQEAIRSNPRVIVDEFAAWHASMRRESGESELCAVNDFFSPGDFAKMSDREYAAVALQRAQDVKTFCDQVEAYTTLYERTRTEADDRRREEKDQLNDHYLNQHQLGLGRDPFHKTKSGPSPLTKLAAQTVEQLPPGFIPFVEFELMRLDQGPVVPGVDKQSAECLVETLLLSPDEEHFETGRHRAQVRATFEGVLSRRAMTQLGKFKISAGEQFLQHLGLPHNLLEHRLSPFVESERNDYGVPRKDKQAQMWVRPSRVIAESGLSYEDDQLSITSTPFPSVWTAERTAHEQWWLSNFSPATEDEHFYGFRKQHKLYKDWKIANSPDPEEGKVSNDRASCLPSVEGSAHDTLSFAFSTSISGGEEGILNIGMFKREREPPGTAKSSRATSYRDFSCSTKRGRDTKRYERLWHDPLDFFFLPNAIDTRIDREKICPEDPSRQRWGVWVRARHYTEESESPSPVFGMSWRRRGPSEHVKDDPTRTRTEEFYFATEEEADAFVAEFEICCRIARECRYAKPVVEMMSMYEHVKNKTGEDNYCSWFTHVYPDKAGEKKCSRISFILNEEGLPLLPTETEELDQDQEAAEEEPSSEKPLATPDLNTATWAEVARVVFAHRLKQQGRSESWCPSVRDPIRFYCVFAEDEKEEGDGEEVQQ
ncbi:unnamed protein product [Amoebophrya sp. A120]|nr:unnamed protein product [Amoebophrya sp. A120]|eukprot:GSA120T00024872001.1